MAGFFQEQKGREWTAGEVVQSAGGRSCFIPCQPPKRIVLSSALQRTHDEAMHQLGAAGMCAALLRSPKLLVLASLRKEAIASSTIEGTVVSADELERARMTTRVEDDRVREVRNYGDALDLGVSRVRSERILLPLILELHRTLMKNVRGQVGAGELKRSQNFVGVIDGQVERAVYTPPPPERTPELMRSLAFFMHDSDDLSPLVRAAMTHWFFESIHPFADGNGRIGRLLIVLQLIQDGVVAEPVIYPSVYFERHRATYMELLQETRMTSDPMPWVHFFLKALREQAKQTIELAQALLTALEDLRGLAADVRAKASAMAVLEAFFESPLQSVAELSRATGLAYNTVDRALQSLSESGIVRRANLDGPRAFVCQPIYDLIFPPSQSSSGVSQS